METKPGHTGHQTTPDTYLQAELGIRNTDAQHKQLVTVHKILLKSYYDYLGVKETGKKIILYAVGNNALMPLKKQYISFRDLLVLAMIDPLSLKTAIRMTMVQKHKYKTTGYNNPWNPTTGIPAYLTQLNCLKVSLCDCGTSRSEAENAMKTGAQMWQSVMFTEEQMVLWEN